MAATARARGSLTSWTRKVRSPPDGLLAASPNEAAHSPLSRCAVALLPPAAVKCAQFLSEFTVPGDNYYDDDRKKYVEMMVRRSFVSFDLGSLADFLPPPAQQKVVDRRSKLIQISLDDVHSVRSLNPPAPHRA